jgi:hypothetical protein
VPQRADYCVAAGAGTSRCSSATESRFLDRFSFATVDMSRSRIATESRIGMRSVVATTRCRAVERDVMQTRTDAGFAFLRTLLRRAAERAQTWRKLIGARYRPEKHYMRGPGPKWRERVTSAGTRRSSDASQGG